MMDTDDPWFSKRDFLKFLKFKSVFSVIDSHRVPWWVGGVVFEYEVSWFKVALLRNNTILLQLEKFFNWRSSSENHQTDWKILIRFLSMWTYALKGWRELVRVNQYVGIRPLCCRRLTTCCSCRGTKWPIYLSTALAQSAAATQGCNGTGRTHRIRNITWSVTVGIIFICSLRNLFLSACDGS